MDYSRNLIESKYHLAIVERLFRGYNEIGNKRFVTGIITELAKSSSNLIKAFLIKEKNLTKNPRKNLKTFTEKIGPKYLEKNTITNLLRTLEIEHAQKISPIEYSKKDKIILLINGKYYILTIKRIKEFTKSVQLAIEKFPL